MKIFIILLSLVLVLGSVGCKSTKPKYRFPADISSQCHGAKNYAKQCIESTSGRKLKAYDCAVTKVPGQRKFSSGWAFYYDGNVSPYNLVTIKTNDVHATGIWVHGITDGNLIQVACDPNTGAVNTGTLNHEFGHHWLIKNYRDASHNPIYSGCFEGWFAAGPQSLDKLPADRVIIQWDSEPFVWRDIIKNLTTNKTCMVTVYGVNDNGTPFTACGPAQ